ncbi:MAG: lmo0937 family membrane protein [Patescibacteria group bacterium]
MLETLIVVLIVLWLLGYRFSRGGNFIHIFLVVVVVILLLKLL